MTIINKKTLLVFFCSVFISNSSSFFSNEDNPMSMIRWRPFAGLDYFNEDSNQSLDLAVDMYEEGNNIMVKMNVPGIDADNIKIEVHNRHLHISGRREEKKEEKDKDYYRKEIRSGSFERVVSLPHPVNESDITAELTDGVLKIIMPKIAEEEKTGRTIKVVRK